MILHEQHRLARRAYWINQQEGRCASAYRIYTHPTMAAFTDLERAHANHYKPKGQSWRRRTPSSTPSIQPSASNAT